MSYDFEEDTKMTQYGLKLWRADTRFSVDDEQMQMHFATLRNSEGIKTHVRATHAAHPLIEFRAVVVAHPYKRATYDQIEDAHKAAELDFNMFTRKARRYYERH